MSYNKTNWTKTTAITPTSLNKIENGIEENSNAITEIARQNVITNGEPVKAGYKIDDKDVYIKRISFMDAINGNDNGMYALPHGIVGAERIWVNYEESHFYEKNNEEMYGLPIYFFRGKGNLDAVFCTVKGDNIEFIMTSGWNNGWEKVITLMYY